MYCRKTISIYLVLALLCVSQILRAQDAETTQEKESEKKTIKN